MTQINLNNLQNGKEYQVKIRVRNHIGYSEYVSIQGQPGHLPEKAINLRGQAYNGSVYLQWDKVIEQEQTSKVETHYIQKKKQQEDWKDVYDKDLIAYWDFEGNLNNKVNNQHNGIFHYNTRYDEETKQNRIQRENQKSVYFDGAI